MKRNQLARQAAAMKSQLVKMGYTPEFINEYLETKAAKQRSDMQKGIISLFFKNSDFSIAFETVVRILGGVPILDWCRAGGQVGNSAKRVIASLCLLFENEPRLLRCEEKRKNRIYESVTWYPVPGARYLGHVVVPGTEF